MCIEIEYTHLILHKRIWLLVARDSWIALKLTKTIKFATFLDLVKNEPHFQQYSFHIHTHPTTEAATICEIWFSHRHNWIIDGHAGIHDDAASAKKSHCVRESINGRGCMQTVAFGCFFPLKCKRQIYFSCSSFRENHIKANYYCVSNTMEPNHKQNTADSLELFIVVIFFPPFDDYTIFQYYCKIYAAIWTHFNSVHLFTFIHIHSISSAIYILQNFYIYNSIITWLETILVLFTSSQYQFTFLIRFFNFKLIFNLNLNKIIINKFVQMKLLCWYWLNECFFYYCFFWVLYVGRNGMYDVHLHLKKIIENVKTTLLMWIILFKK